MNDVKLKRRSLLFVAIGLMMLVIAPSAPSSANAQANSTEIRLQAFNCPPGMTAETLDGDACESITSGFDVLIVSREGIMTPLTLADAELDGATFVWLDKIGVGGRMAIKQTVLPGGATSYMFDGPTVEPDDFFVWIFRLDFDSPEIDLRLYSFSPGPAVAPTPESTPLPERAHLDEPIHLADGLDLTHYWIAPAPGKTDLIQIFGEILNTTDRELDAPQITFTLTGQNGDSLGTVLATPLVQTIPPGRLTPFVGHVDDPSIDVDAIADATPTLCGVWGADTRVIDDGLGLADLRIGSVKERSLTSTEFRVEGRVRNSADQPAENVWVKAAIYDQEDRYVGAIETAIDDPIATGETARFQLESLAGAGASDAPSPLVYTSDDDYTYELWVGRGSDDWPGC